MVTANINDLEFILQQIKIAEADARGEQILGTLVPNTELPWGLRRVDGSNNNLNDGQGHYGAADVEFPRNTSAVWVNEGDDGMAFGPPVMNDGVPVDFGFDGVPPGYIPLNNGLGPDGTDLRATYLNNNDYEIQVANNPALGPREIQAGDVVDADPRIISNLIVDQTLNNPAVLIAALHHAGSADPYADALPILEAYKAYQDASGGAADLAAAASETVTLMLDAAGLVFESSPSGDLEKLTVVVPNVAPDEGLSAPFNSWMTIFGQFFDHGLDLVKKGDFGTVYIPLQPDDPLYDPDSPQTNFMVVSRTTLNENGQPINKTTPYVDQNQTYGSHASKQVFMREYDMVDGAPASTGYLLLGSEGSGGGLATWADIKAQAREKLGIELNDLNIHEVPLVATDPYGNFIPGANGLPQLVLVVDGQEILVEGNLDAPVSTTGAVSSGHAFLDDIAHNANPSATTVADADTDVSTADQRMAPGTYDDELLNMHYITGDGRGNENIALTAVHHVFHGEHNLQVDKMKGTLLEHAQDILLQTGDVAVATELLNEWLVLPVGDANLLEGATVDDLFWNGTRLFQSAKFVTEMQYQHLVFEEFARKVQPFVNGFLDYNGELDAAILGEFAHTVYRFGHSMLNEMVDRYDENYNADHIDLIAAFLNPVEYANSGIDAEAAAGAIARGMTRQVGNEIDEFVTEALRNNLVGLPLDLAAINIARGRETGVPSLNEARAQFFAGSGDSQVKPYESWQDFAFNLKTPASVINFIAAYGTHETIVNAATAADKRDAAMALVMGGEGAPEDRMDFLTATGAYEGGSLGGLNTVDFWIGGLAEKKMVFGGMLGSTFNFVFEVQLEALQDGDRFYYLTRLANLNLTAQMENNKFSEMIHRHTTAEHLPGDVFSRPDYFIEADQSKQFNEDLGNADPTDSGDPILSAMAEKVIRVDANQDGISEYVRFVGAEHVVFGGTDGNDTLIGGKGDDTLWGDAGNDRLEGGEGNDFFFGGDGDDIITDEFGDDEIRSGAGDDVVTAGQGFNLIITDTGSDFIFGGVDVDDILAGQDNDFARGSLGGSMVMGGEGNDWVEAAAGNNLLLGDNGDLVQGLPIKRSVDSSIVGHDVLIGGAGNDDFDAETGDDIMVGGRGTNKFFGQLGFDWASFANDQDGVHSDMENRLFAPPATATSTATMLDRYSQTEAVSGSAQADILRGDDLAGLGADHGLSDANVSLIEGLEELLGTIDEAGDLRFSAGNILLGGGGSDILEGRGGDDLIDGDRYLDVKIKVTPENGDDPYFVSNMSEIREQMFAGEIKPRELSIWREIKDGSAETDVDVVEFAGQFADYAIEGYDAETGLANDVDGDGFISITDNGANAVTGTDRVVNVERALFADGTVKIQAHDNSIAEGRVRIEDGNGQQMVDGQPIGVEGMVLRASMAGVTDADNQTIDNAEGAITGPVEFTWQVETVAGSGLFTNIQRIVADNFTTVTGDAYTVTADVAGLAIRAVARFLDAAGAVETVFSNVGADRFVQNPVVLPDAPVAPAGDQIVLGAGRDTVTGTTGNDQIDAGAGRDTVNGGAGNDVIIAGAGRDTVTGGPGNDVISLGAGRDTAIWNVGDGMDIISDTGGNRDTFIANGDASNEVFTVYAAANFTATPINPQAEIVITRSVDGGPEILIAQLSGIDEIQINTGGGTNNVNVIGNFGTTDLNFNTITVNGTTGNDAVDITLLDSAHRILFRSSGGNDTIVGTIRPQDVILLPEGSTLSDFARTEGENGTVTLSDGTRSVTYVESGGAPFVAVEGSQEAVQLQQLGTLDPETGTLVAQPQAGAYDLTEADLLALEAMVRPVPAAPAVGDDAAGDDGIGLDQPVSGVRDLPGLDNNLKNPGFGAATEPFIRITDAHYGDLDENGNRAINPIFSGLDPRTISNVIGAQEAGTAPEADANMFFMSFGQYFDHGLTFIPKTTANGTIQIGGAGSMRAPGSDNPADLTRAKVVGFDDNGVPQHENITSPFVDQNQVYGSSSLIGQFLRESDGAGGVGMRVLLGADDPSAPGHQLLSTLRGLLDHHIEAGTVFKGTDQGDKTLLEYYPDLLVDGAYNQAVVSQLSGDFMGEGWPLLIDTNPYINLLDHFIGGDGRANENVGLTSMHTIWARNHNHHVEKLLDAGFDGTQEEIFQAAKMLNEAEYQRIVFDEFADKLLGGMKGTGTHGFDNYNPDADARISHEFAAAAYRVGHTMIGQTLTILDENGAPKDIPLFDVFLNPTNNPDVFMIDPDMAGPAPTIMGAPALDALAQYGYTPQPGYAEYGTARILAGLAGQASEGVDVNMVDAVRNDLVRVNADLFSFNVARGWDLGLGTLNQVRADLMTSTDPYVGEAVFNAGDLSPYASWDEFQDRNGLSDDVIAQFKTAYPDLLLDSAEKIAAFEAANPGLALIDNGDGTKTVGGIDRVDLWVGGLAEARINGGVVGQTFWVIIHEQFDRLQEGDRFYYTERFDNLPVYQNFLEGQSFADIVMRNTGIQNLSEDVFSSKQEDASIILPSIQVDVGDLPVTETPITEGPAVDETSSQQFDTQRPGAEQNQTTEGDKEEVEGEAATELEATSTTSDETGAPAETKSKAMDKVEASTETESDETESASEEEEAASTDAEDDDAAEAPEHKVLVATGVEALIAGAGNDVLRGGEGSDFLMAGDGADIMMGGACNDDLIAGEGDDMVYGDAGNDRIFADGGNDTIVGGSGADMAYGGEGDDTFIGTDGDGNDIYYGGAGTDTIDLSAITEALEIRLGNAGTERGSVTGGGQMDVIWGFENAIGGAGDDKIVASEAANILDGGAGNDTFVFETATAANGTMIKGFAAGDVLCFSDIDADTSMDGNQGFTLAGRGAEIGAGELTFSHGSEEGADITTVTGMTNEGQFEVKLSGHVNLEEENFLL